MSPVSPRPPVPGAPLRALTYLAPGVPLELFELVCEHLGRRLSREVRLESESRSSGPMHGERDPFAEGGADIGFLCSPSYLYLSSRPEPSVALVPAAFVFRDERAGGRAVYFSEATVRADHPARCFADLEGTVWGYNDDCSLSGYFAALQKLAELGCEGGFFGRRVHTGSHHASIEALLAGTIDCAAIDSTVLTRLSRERPDVHARLRVVDSWGPFPVPPIVARRALGAELVGRIAGALLELGSEPGQAQRLARHGFERCAPTDESAYAEERRALCALGQIPGPLPEDHLS